MLKHEEKNSIQTNFHLLTPECWADFEKLFGKRGACGGCWCMYWKLKHSEFEDQKGESNRQAMKARVESGEIPGILAYLEEEPIAWCALEPRENYPRLSRSRILKPIDDAPVWSIVCFFVAKKYRNQGLTRQLLHAAIEYVKAHGGTILEGYPVEPKKDRIPAAFAYTGLASAFKNAGFVECARRSETRPIMRYFIK
jgi:GNAT superfamily N-acetyltransferase